MLENKLKCSYYHRPMIYFSATRSTSITGQGNSFIPKDRRRKMKLSCNDINLWNYLEDRLIEYCNQEQSIFSIRFSRNLVACFRCFRHRTYKNLLFRLNSLPQLVLSNPHKTLISLHFFEISSYNTLILDFLKHKMHVILPHITTNQALIQPQRYRK